MRSEAVCIRAATCQLRLEMTRKPIFQRKIGKAGQTQEILANRMPPLDVEYGYGVYCCPNRRRNECYPPGPTARMVPDYVE